MSSSRDHAPSITAVTSGQSHTPSMDDLILRFRGPAADIEAHANVAYWMRSYECEGVGFQLDTLLEAADRVAAYAAELRAAIAAGTGPLEGRTGQLREDQ